MLEALPRCGGRTQRRQSGGGYAGWRALYCGLTVLCLPDSTGPSASGPPVSWGRL
jgi:hypothetical protein